MQTDVERKLWSRLSNRQVAGCKFVRQEPIGPYFADFACRERKIVVELDGSQHIESERDVVRDAYLSRSGYRVLRFWNGEVNANLAGVLDTIFAALEESAIRLHSPLAGSGQLGEADRVRGDPPTSWRVQRPSSGRADARLDVSPQAGRRIDLAGALRADIPGLRGTIEADAPTARLSWFRTGGPAEVLFTPADEADLALFLAGCPAEVPVLVVGLGSNLLIRDGGVPGVVIRLGRAFATIAIEAGHRVRAGAGAADVKVARAAAEAGIDGLAFLRGIPGTIGGALRMNGGAYGGETAHVLVEARALDRTGRTVRLGAAEMGFTYRHCGAPENLVFTEALFQGRPGVPDAILAAMSEITEARSATQPVNTRTGGSTFKNPPGRRAWELVDRAGCRGLAIGAAQVSELHCNFLVNRGGATAAEIEALGEEVRRRVRETSGVELEWEIARVGIGASHEILPVTS